MTARDAFVALGFSDIESRIYCELLRGGPSTGYRLAGSIGKAAANVYQALEALLRRGAVMVDDKEARIFRAVAVSEVIAALESDFKKRSSLALESLQSIETVTADDRLYHLKTAAQVLERGRAMIGAARKILLFDLYPGPLDLFGPDLEKAASRGLTVAGVTYGDAPKLRIEHLHTHPRSTLSKRWPGQQITLISDASEYLVALLSEDGKSVLHSAWSDSRYLACLQHSGLASEIQAAAMAPTIPAALRSLDLLKANPPGLKQLLGRPRSKKKQESKR
jgi:sugar-specific transcriptional regulator TrmB